MYLKMSVEKYYSTCENELDDTELELVSGERVPSWVKGVLYRNGPAMFEIGNDKFNHWFDGQAMIHAFRINAGTNRVKKCHNNSLIHYA